MAKAFSSEHIAWLSRVVQSFGEEHRVLIAQLEALLRANRCAVSGIEVVFDAEGKGYVIDVNTCNTSKYFRSL